jgi:DnaJ family protein C protein 8
MTSAAAETNFSTFYQDLKATEKADSVLTSKQQIERLLRPGCTYRNLNPYEVLQIDPELPIEDVRKKYRRLSILVHLKAFKNQIAYFYPC